MCRTQDIDYGVYERKRLEVNWWLPNGLHSSLAAVKLSRARQGQVATSQYVFII